MGARQLKIDSFQQQPVDTPTGHLVTVPPPVKHLLIVRQVIRAPSPRAATLLLVGNAVEINELIGLNCDKSREQSNVKQRSIPVVRGGSMYRPKPGIGGCSIRSTITCNLATREGMVECACKARL